MTDLVFVKLSKAKCHKWLIGKFPVRITCLCSLENLFFFFFKVQFGFALKFQN